MLQRPELLRITWHALRFAAMLVVLATLWIWALANVIQVTLVWEFDDIHAYLAAGQRLLDGGPLYISAADMSDLYLYAPWFAFAWVPLTWLPVEVVEVGWAAVLLAAFAACVWPFWRTVPGLAVALLLGGLLYRTVGWGNVQPVLVAALIYLLPTRAGPWVVGIATSLKPWPILAVAAYAWKRQWRAAAIATTTALVLWLPVFLFNWTAYPAGARGPNIYDVTFLLALPPLLNAVRAAGHGQAQPAPGRSGSRAGAAG